MAGQVAFCGSAHCPDCAHQMPGISGRIVLYISSSIQYPKGEISAEWSNPGNLPLAPGEVLKPIESRPTILWLARRRGSRLSRRAGHPSCWGVRRTCKSRYSNARQRGRRTALDQPRRSPEKFSHSSCVVCCLPHRASHLHE